MCLCGRLGYVCVHVVDWGMFVSMVGVHGLRSWPWLMLVVVEYACDYGECLCSRTQSGMLLVMGYVIVHSICSFSC